MNPIKVFLAGTVVAFMALSLLTAAAFSLNAPVTGTLTGIIMWAPNTTPVTSATFRVGDTDLVVQTGAVGRFTMRPG
jgi:hypothetical protein